jgi:CHAD domain-containing protein
MRFPASPRSAIGRRLRSLERGLSANLATDVEALHRTRVATRRLREALPLLPPASELAEADRQGLREASKAIRDLTRALGGVRELDVAKSILDEVAGAHPDLASGVSAIRSAIDDARDRRLQQLQKRVEVGRLHRTSRALAEIAGRTGGHHAPALRRRIPHRAARLKTAVAKAGLVYAAEQLHEVRIAAKKLRYALELAEEVEGRPTRPFVQELKQIQDLLGRLHDLQVVATFACTVSTDRDREGEVRRAAAAVGDLLDLEIHQGHADYVARRRQLRELSDQAVALVRVPGPSPARRGSGRAAGKPSATTPDAA